MPIKLEIQDNTSQIKVSPSNNTSQVNASHSDNIFYILLNKEIRDRIAGDEHLQEEIDAIVEHGARYVLIEENSDGSITISLLNEAEQVLSSQTIHITEKIIKEGVLDYEHSKIIYTCNDDSIIELDVSDIVNAIHQLESDLANEVARATQAEADLHQEVVDETERATQAEQALQDDIDAEESRAKAREDEIEDALEVEVARATQAEQDLNTRIDNLDLATVGSNGGYIKTVGQQDGQLSATRQAFDTDMTNATNDNAPTTKNAKDYTDTLFTRENNRAIEEETKLGQAIEDEEDRAKLVEQGLQNSIDVEVAARGDADTAINARIDALDLVTVGSDGGYIKTITQADGQVSATRQAFDTSLTNADDTNVPTSKTVKDYVDAETTRATTAESALGSRIDDLDLTEVGASGSYIKLVSQSNGQVSATSQALDTTISGSSDNTNAPTSKAVKDYVDTYGGKIDSISINGVNQPIVNKNVDLPTVRTDVDNQNLSSTQKANAKTNLDLNNVDNTSDLNKPISTATQTALDDKVDKKTTSGDFVYTHNTTTQSEVAYTSNDNASTIVMRDANKQINVAQTPTSDSHAAAKKYVDTQDSAISSALTTHINDTSNPHHVTATNVGLGLVENTGDSATPLSGGLTKFTTGGAYTLQTTLQGNIDTVDDKLNVNVHIEGNSDEITYSGDTVTKISPYQNLKTGATGTRSEQIRLANSNDAGLMSHTDYLTIIDHTRRLDALEGTPVRLIYTASQNPTAAQIKTFVDTYLAGKGVLTPTDSDYNSVSVKVNGTNHIWNYYANDSAYKDDGLDTVTQFTNSIAGIIQGTATDGFVYAESNGTGSVYGWDALKTRVTNVETGMVSDINYDTTNKKFTKTKNNVTSDVVSASTLKSDMNLDQVANGAQVNTIESISINGTAQTIDSNKNVDLPAYPSKTSDLTNDSDFATNTYVDTELAKKQNTIDLSHQLDADLVDDSTSTHKFVTTQTAYANKGSATKVPQITTNALGQVTSITEIPITDNNDNQTVKVGNVTFGDNDVVNFTGSGTTTVTGDASTKTITITSSDSHVGDVVSVGATSGSHIAIGGTGANPTVGVESGYSIPSNTKQGQWDAKYDKPSGGIPDTDIASAATWNAKQDALTFDNAPTSGSSNPVKSGGVYTALSGKQDTLTTQTAYSAQGTSLKVPQITTNSLGQVTLIEEKDIAFPSPGDGVLTIQRNGTTLKTFTANQSTNETVNISVPVQASDIGAAAASDLANYLPLAGGAMIGTITGAQSGKGIVFQSTDQTGSWSEGVYILDASHNKFSTLTLGNSDKSDLLGFVHNGVNHLYYADVRVSGTTYTINFPHKSGTFALTSDIPSLSGYATETWVSTNYVPKAGDGAKPAMSNRVFSSNIWSTAPATWTADYDAAPGYEYGQLLRFKSSIYNAIQLTDFYVRDDASALWVRNNWNAQNNTESAAWGPWHRIAEHGDNVSSFTNDAGYVTSSGSVAYASSAGNADTVDGYHASDFASASHDHTVLNTAFRFNNSDLPENSDNFASYAHTHSIDFFRNGMLIPYTDSNANDGGIIRCRGTETDCIFEIATWDDYGAGETIQFNYYPTTSTTTPTYSVSVPKKSGTLAIDGDAQPASDVYSWAKQASKPSYNFSEIQPGTAVVDYSGGIVFRNESTAWYSGIYYSTPNEEAVIFANKSQGNQDAAYQQQWLFAYTDMQNREAWTDLGSKTAMQIKGHRVAINKMVGNNTQIPYNLDVNGTGHFSSNLQIDGSITNLATNGGIYWNPYVESSSDPSDTASITVLSSGAAGGTELRIQQANDSNDIINLVSPAYIYMNGKRAFTIDDSWLRINETPSAGFGSGIYTGTSVVRTDLAFQVGNDGGAFYANSSGQVYANTSVQVKSCKMQYNTSEDCLDFIFA